MVSESEKRPPLPFPVSQEDMATERLVLDDRAKEARLRQVAAVEEAYRGNIKAMREAWEKELEEMRREQEHK